MQFDVITLFPDMFAALTSSGITRRAFEQKRCELSLWNPRDFTSDNHRTVDDRPYGGGPGMVMMAISRRVGLTIVPFNLLGGTIFRSSTHPTLVS